MIGQHRASRLRVTRRGTITSVAARLRSVADRITAGHRPVVRGGRHGGIIVAVVMSFVARPCRDRAVTHFHGMVMARMGMAPHGEMHHRGKRRQDC